MLFFYLNNEPLLDEHIIEKIQYAKEKMPKTKIVLSTNACFLTPDRTRQLSNYVDNFIFSVFGVKEQSYKRMMPGLDYYKTMANIDYFIKFKKENRNKVMVRYIAFHNDFLKDKAFEHLRSIFNFWKDRGIICKHDIFFSRAGNVFSFSYNSKNFKYVNRLRGCWFYNIPLTSIHIIFNGDVILCCMDIKREVILGNVREKSIYEIWNGELYNKVRDRIYLNKYNDKDGNFLCKRCENPYNDLLSNS